MNLMKSWKIRSILFLKKMLNLKSTNKNYLKSQKYGKYDNIYILNSNKNKDIEKINNKLLENSKNEIFDSIKKDIELKYSNDFKSLNKTIEDFKIDIKNKDDIINNLKTTVIKENKYKKNILISMMISKTIRILIKMHNEVEYLNEKAV